MAKNMVLTYLHKLDPEIPIDTTNQMMLDKPAPQHVAQKDMNFPMKTEDFTTGIDVGRWANFRQTYHLVNGSKVNVCLQLYIYIIIEGSLEVKLPTIWTDEKQSRAEAERRGRLEERRSEEKE